MNGLRSFSSLHPAIFGLIVTAVWFVLLMVIMMAASTVLRRPYGDASTVSISRLVVTGCVIFLIYSLGWLGASGITRLGSWQGWLLALGVLVYMAGASLYAMYGKVTFDLPHAFNQPGARGILTGQALAGLSEEILFRGLILYALFRVWGNTPHGAVWSVVFAALLFASLHITQVFLQGLPPAAALLLIAETVIIAICWGALVIFSGSIWPAVLLHIAVNVIVGLQGLTAPMVTPEVLAYQRLLLFSIPAGVLGILLLAQFAPQAAVHGTV